MSVEYEIEVRVRRNGKPVSGLHPFIRRLTVDEDGAFEYEHADDADAVTFTSIPDAKIAEAQLLAISPSRQATIRLDGQTDAGLVINAGGLLLAIDADIDNGAGVNASINNNSGGSAVISGLVAGT